MSYVNFENDSAFGVVVVYVMNWGMYDISHTLFHDLNFFGRIETSFEYENRSNTTMILQKN